MSPGNFVKYISSKSLCRHVASFHSRSTACTTYVVSLSPIELRLARIDASNIPIFEKKVLNLIEHID